MKTKLIWLATVTLLAALMISGTAFAEGEVPPALPEEPAAVVVETAPPAEEPAAPAEPAPEVPQAPRPKRRQRSRQSRKPQRMKPH